MTTIFTRTGFDPMGRYGGTVIDDRMIEGDMW
ncbi:hypothetical protein GGR93_001840 [Sulfitobacter noctilucicola]|uniref:Uncharacterized protein n=1 Tax=Sulfitobacter noctilucicola TaxID=1342301 RepID=A0A7W6Q5Q8_9RHOB|nr:hypothetical protein [Sulfitobacter noctilucicola]